MGMDSSADLFYGFDFYCEEESEDDGYGPKPKCLDEEDWFDENFLGSWNKTKEACGVGTCGDHAPILFLAIKESHRGTGARYCTPITLPETKPEWDAQIKEFCDKNGITYKKPGWHLASRHI